MKRIFFALGTTALALSGCYIEDGEMKVTPNNFNLDYRERQLQLATDHDIISIEVTLEDVSYTYTDDDSFYVGNYNAAVYDCKWISIVHPLTQSNKRTSYVLCNENRSSEPRQCKIRIRNFFGSDYVTITQEGCPEPIGIKDAECQEQNTTYLP